MTETMSPAEFLTAIKVARVRLPLAVAARNEEVAYHAEKGHRPSHCIHGTNQWTEYDNICGGCEEGVTLRRMVVQSAVRDTMEFGRRLRVVGTAIGTALREGMPFDTETLYDWAKEPLSDLD